MLKLQLMLPRLSVDHFHVRYRPVHCYAADTVRTGINRVESHLYRTACLIYQYEVCVGSDESRLPVAEHYLIGFQYKLLCFQRCYGIIVGDRVGCLLFRFQRARSASLWALRSARRCALLSCAYTVVVTMLVNTNAANAINFFILNFCLGLNYIVRYKFIARTMPIRRLFTLFLIL